MYLRQFEEAVGGEGLPRVFVRKSRYYCTFLLLVAWTVPEILAT